MTTATRKDEVLASTYYKGFFIMVKHCPLRSDRGLVYGEITRDGCPVVRFQEVNMPWKRLKGHKAKNVSEAVSNAFCAIDGHIAAK